MAGAALAWGRARLPHEAQREAAPQELVEVVLVVEAAGVVDRGEDDADVHPEVQQVPLEVVVRQDLRAHARDGHRDDDLPQRLLHRHAPLEPVVWVLRRRRVEAVPVFADAGCAEEGCPRGSLVRLVQQRLVRCGIL